MKKWFIQTENDADINDFYTLKQGKQFVYFFIHLFLFLSGLGNWKLWISFSGNT
jgi:hypothetical protein